MKKAAQSTMDNETNTHVRDGRRDFLKASGLAAGAGALLGQLPAVKRILASRRPAAYNPGDPRTIIHSVCLNCHNACTMQGRIQDGVLVKLGGNPYSAQNLLPHLPEDTPLAEAAKAEAPLCPKGQAGIQVLYDPYRLRKVLKRRGKRGENRWETISWEQFIQEVVEGGDLFGEGHVDGLRDVYKLRDPELSKALGADAEAVASGEMTLEEFKERHADYLDLLIDPEHPDLGPVNNQFVFLGGRVEHGRKELTKRFTYESFGSVNYYLHTTICEQSHHIAYKMMSGKTHMKPDTANSEFVIYFGTSPFEANFGPTNMVPKMTSGLVERNFKYAVVDPRLSKTAAKAWKWLPIRPGGDAAVALGMMRWMFEHERYDARYLSAPNAAAAASLGEPSHSDATHLVRTDEMIFLKVEDAGITPPVDKEGNAVDSRVVMVDGVPTPSATAGLADLCVDTTIRGIPVKSVLQLLKERVEEYSLEEYAEMAGVRPRDLEELAHEFTSHGKKAAAELYRGPVQHTNGYYNAQAIISLNVLLGNVDWKGGLTKGGGHWHEDGSKPGAPFPKSVITSTPGGLKKFGVHVNRESTAYEATTLFEGYPAKRPWYPFTKELYQNVIPSAAAGYPYPIKVLFIQKGTPIMASPAGHLQIGMLRDPKKIPLVIACDIVIGETSMYADYILPDLTYMERWGAPHISPDVTAKLSKIRQPMVAPLTEEVVIDGEAMPISLEAFLLAVGKALDMPGFGEDALGPSFPLDRPEQYYLAMAANLAFGDKEDGSEILAPATEEEMRIFREARAHLPPSMFDEKAWRAAVPSALWGSVVTLLNHGGRFEPYEKSYKGAYMGHAWAGRWNLYVEKVAKGRNSLTGEHFDGLPRIEPIMDAAGNPLQSDEGDLALITYKEVTGGQSRTHGAYWLGSVLPENFVLVHRSDAERLSLKEGDRVRLTSSSLPSGEFELGDGRSLKLEGKLKPIEGIRPGTVAVSWSYGHWAYGSNTVEIDGQSIPGDPRRGTGIVPNPAMWVDPSVGDVCLTDPIGGSASFYDTYVRLERA